jgi:hypothetical protein
VSYVIADEPHETSWRHLVVHPNGPLLAEMLCGTWLALPWFIANSYALGSPTRRKELALCGLQVAVTIVLGLVVLWLRDSHLIESRTVLQICLLGIVTWKLAIAYAITRVQGAAYQVYELGGGNGRSPTLVIMSGLVLKDYVFGLFDHPLWGIIVTGIESVQ